MSPTVLRSGPFRFFFFSNDATEPPHVHVQRGKKLAKFWLKSGELAFSVGFAPHELTKLRRLILANHGRLEEAWHEFFAR